MSGEAMQMQIEIASLMKRHRVAPGFARIIPLSSPIDYDAEIEGLAATIDVDLSRQKFRGWCFENLCLTLSGYPRPPLLFKHDPNQIAGIITRLTYDDRGQLLISADVTHELARRCNAFSVCATVLQYEIRNADSADFFALISKARIDEISLTDRPANPNALVRSRSRIAPVNAYLETLGARADLEIKAISVIQRQLEILQATFKTPARAAPRAQGDNVTLRPKRGTSPPTAAVTTPRRPTQFQALAAALNERTA